MKMGYAQLALLGSFGLSLIAAAPGQSKNDSSRKFQTEASVSAKVEDPVHPDVKLPADYVIGADDVLGINVWKEPEFSQPVPVRSDGNISLPLIGEIKAAGKTPIQLEQDITTKLSTYFKEPEVNVMVVQMNSRKFNILGRVRKPGAYSLAATKTVLDAIAEAGGFQDFAKVKDIFILRKDADGQESRLPFNYKDVVRGKHSEENVTLKPHDTIVVP